MVERAAGGNPLIERPDFNQQVEALEKLWVDTKAQEELGRKLLGEVARAIQEEKQNLEMANPDTEITIQKGDLVPDQLRAQVPADAAGRALNDTLVQNLNLRIWFRIWIRFWLRIIFGTRFATTPLNQFQDFADRVKFTSQENELIGRLKEMTNISLR